MVKKFWEIESNDVLQKQSSSTMPETKQRVPNIFKKHLLLKIVDIPPGFYKMTTRATKYIPLHPVTNIIKPKKVRIVFDAVALVKGKSLNEHLLKGADILNNLVSVLSKFRSKAIRQCAVIVDITETFHQLKFF